MSCNPAIGGVGNGQLVKEIDALGGQMAKSADACAIQFRMLNASKGAAVQSSRSQIYRMMYQKYMQRVVTEQKNLSVVEGETVGLIVKDNQVLGVKTNDDDFYSNRVIIDIENIEKCINIAREWNKESGLPFYNSHIDFKFDEMIKKCKDEDLVLIWHQG